MKEVAIAFTTDGTGHCLYHEEIDLHTIGVLACTRASHVEFAPDTQRWQVTLPDDGRVLFASPSRQDCLDWERKHLAPAIQTGLTEGPPST